MDYNLSIPVEISVSHFSQDFSTFMAEYKHKKIKCKVEFAFGEEVSEGIYEIGDQKFNYFSATSKSLIYTISDDDDHSLEKLANAGKWRELDNCFQKIMNRFIKVLRVRGRVAFLELICDLREGYPDDSRLKLWGLFKPEPEADVKVGWQTGLLSGCFFTPPTFHHSQTANARHFDSKDWTNVLIALAKKEYDRFPAEDELLVNAVEHLQDKRLKLAIIETVTALEAVLDRYLKAYSEMEGVEKNYYNDLFGASGAGLRNKLAVIFRLTEYGVIGGDEKVFKLIENRNAVIHKGKDFPESDSEMIAQEIAETKVLISYIQNALFLVENRDAIDNIRKAISSEYSLPLPAINIMNPRFLIINVNFYSIENMHVFPSNQEKANAIITRLRELILDWDPTLTAERYLLNVSFFEYPSGKTILYEKKKINESVKNISLIQDEKKQGFYRFKIRSIQQ